MAFSGMRDLSVIQTPPPDRIAVRTQVARVSEDLIREAIDRELHRGGQVFFVHNRIETIGEIADYVRRVVPSARVVVAHGQMSGSALEKTMLKFLQREFDVLVATTIIENGLDIPNANTMIVNRADRYGLAQLYQLRGRERAYAYFLWNAEKPLGEVALERLKAVAAHNELGSGYQLAMKDLEIRGAGNLLGGEQSGHIAGVGFDLYLRLVGEAVADFKGESDEKTAEMKIELPVNAHLPHDYVPGERLRLEAYRKIAAATDFAALDDVLAELVDRYGQPPAPVVNLLEVARIRIRARALGLTDVAMMGNAIKFAPAAIANLPDSRQLRLARMYKGAADKPALNAITIPKPKTSAIGGRDLVDEQILEWVSSVLSNIFEVEAPRAKA
jgi:transcription-repair coupling factor (superfamily II helicase)